MKTDAKTSETRLIGRVVEKREDRTDEAFPVVISTDHGDYRVEPNPLSEELFDRLDMKVEVVGFLERDKEGTRRIRVTDYKLLPDDEDLSSDVQDEGD